jgi:hypothetical protein
MRNRRKLISSLFVVLIVTGVTASAVGWGGPPTGGKFYRSSGGSYGCRC